MKIFYRVCPFLSNKEPAVSWDKYTMIKNCYQSLLKAGGKNIYIINDRLPDQWLDLFTEYEEIIESPAGNEQSFQAQIKTAMNYDGKFLFLEDDYLWRPDTIKHLERSLDELPIVSPYDHPGHYLEERFDKRYETRLIDGMVYRVAPSNTLTFATSKPILEKHLSTFMSYGVADHPMFEAIAHGGENIWNPTHSFATHLVGGLLAPNINWNDIIESWK